MTRNNALIGCTIIGIDIATDKKAIRFQVDGGEPVIARADGDCCSNTWIESVGLPALGFPAKVREVTDLALPNEATDDGCTAFYGCAIDTDSGRITIDYRNESNGYYGGNLSWPGDYFYGGVYGQNDSTMEWQKAEE